MASKCTNPMRPMPITPTRMSFFVSVFSVVMNKAVRGTTSRPYSVDVDAAGTRRFERRAGENATQVETCKDTSSPRTFMIDQTGGSNGLPSVAAVQVEW